VWKGVNHSETVPLNVEILALRIPPKASPTKDTKTNLTVADLSICSVVRTSP